MFDYRLIIVCASNGSEFWIWSLFRSCDLMLDYRGWGLSEEACVFWQQLLYYRDVQWMFGWCDVWLEPLREGFFLKNVKEN